MSKEVILMSDVDGLGIEGDIVKVADGYARNFLLPRKLAAPVSDMARRQLEKHRADREARIQRDREASMSLADKLESLSLTLTAKAGPDGKLFGSVGNADIAEALKGQGIELDRHKIQLDSPLRELGVFDVPVKIAADVQATLKVWVVEE